MSDNNEALFQRLIKSIQEENEKQTETLKREFRAEISEIKTELSQVNAIIKEQSKIVTKLKEKTNILENKYLQTERALKKNNIIIFGLEVQENLVDFIIQQLNSNLKINLNLSDINNLFPVGKPDRSRPIVVQFTSFLKKLEVLKQCKKLKGTKISISEDLTKEDRDIRKRLLKHQAEARKKNYRSYIRGNKLIINNDIFTIEDLEAAEKDTEDNKEDYDYLEIEENFTKGEKNNEKAKEDPESTKISKKGKTIKTNLESTRPVTRRLIKDTELLKDTDKNLYQNTVSISEIK